MIDEQPLRRIRWLPRLRLSANTWNPNHVAPTEMDLLATSLRENGWTQPIVARAVDDSGDLEIVDGFHRWTLSERDDIAALTAGGFEGQAPTEREAEMEKALLDLLDAHSKDDLADLPEPLADAVAYATGLLVRYDAEDAAELDSPLVPVVTLEQTDVATLMMATIRHNRARGAHHVLRMADIVAELSAEGISNKDIGARLGMDRVEVDRLLSRGKMSERGAKGELSAAWHTEHL